MYVCMHAGIPMSTDSIMRIYSASKPIGTVGFLILVDEVRHNLPISTQPPTYLPTYLPTYRAKSS